VDEPIEAADSPNPLGERPASGLAHGLRWAIKRSFVQYVRGMPDGRGWVGNGALPIGTDEMFFSLDRDNSAPVGAGPASQVWAFAGDVRFTGHFGLLFVRIARPWLHVDGQTATMTVDDPHGDPAAPRVPLVTARLDTLEVRDGTTVCMGVQVRLAEAAVEVFNEVYPAGESFEDFVVQLPSLLSLSNLH
jgi:hypothetical protein